MTQSKFAQKIKKLNKNLIYKRLKEVGFIVGILLIFAINGLNVSAQ